MICAAGAPVRMGADCRDSTDTVALPRLLAIILLVSLGLLMHMPAFACQGDAGLSCVSGQASIEIGKPLAGTGQRRISDFFGVHALFWEVQTDLAGSGPSRVSPEASKVLRESKVGFIRYGGAVNEIDWRGCQGWVMERPKQKLVEWLPPLRCVFGPAEYEKLNDELGYDGSWHIANVVGFENRIQPLPRLLADLGDRVALVRELAPQRRRYWELGNELERGWPRWDVKTIAEHTLPAAQRILQQDPAARVILPLLEYRPAWIADDDAHNRYLIRQHKGTVADYALHMYYDNPPWGPSVANRLAYTRRVAGLAAVEGVVTPRLWITEHARPPPGTPEDADWKKGWSQTASHDAVLATADFLIGIAQIPAVQGAAWHGLRAGPWNFIELTQGQPVASRIARLFALLHVPELQTLQTLVRTPSDARLPGGYVLRASAFVPKDAPRSRVLWVVNRGAVAQILNLKDAALLHNGSRYTLTQTQLTADTPVEQAPSAWPRSEDSVQAGDNALRLSIPPRAVVLVRIDPQEAQ